MGSETFDALKLNTCRDAADIGSDLIARTDLLQPVSSVQVGPDESVCVYGLHDEEEDEATLLVFYLDRSDEKGRIHGDTILLLIKV